jgi:hypothetical protein
MKKLEKEMLEIVESKVKQNGLEHTLNKVYTLLEETQSRKERLLQSNLPLHNTNLHIEACLDIIGYLTEKKTKNILAGNL